MPKKIKRSSIAEEVIYIWECPECGEYIEETSDVNDETMLYCYNCDTTFEIED